jgi:hypothetical protein
MIALPVVHGHHAGQRAAVRGISNPAWIGGQNPGRRGAAGNPWQVSPDVQRLIDSWLQPSDAIARPRGLRANAE